MVVNKHTRMPNMLLFVDARLLLCLRAYRVFLVPLECGGISALLFTTLPLVAAAAAAAAVAAAAVACDGVVIRRLCRRVSIVIVGLLSLLSSSLWLYCWSLTVFAILSVYCGV